jgi:hypothetical protein
MMLRSQVSMIEHTPANSSASVLLNRSGIQSHDPATPDRMNGTRGLDRFFKNAEPDAAR